MRRSEAVVLVASGLLSLAAAAVWKFGAYGLAGAGAVLLLVALFVVDVKEG